MNVKYKIRTIVDYNCFLLDVKPPKIEYLPSSEFMTETMRAAVSVTNNKIIVNSDAIKNYQDDDFEIWLTFSHECRHLWQNAQGETDDYIIRLKTDLKNYNFQPLEIDAWAWCVFVSQKNFGIIPVFEKIFGKDFDDEVKRLAKKIVLHREFVPFQ